MDTDVEKSSSGPFERFFVWFLIPLVFTSVLLGVLLSIFDYNVMNGILKAGSKIPGINRILPDPSSTDKSAPVILSASEQLKERQTELENEITRLNQMISVRENELKQAAAAVQQKEQSIVQLQVQVAELQEEMKGKTLSEEEYSQQIRLLASTYAAMLPSRSAPILQFLTTSERVLILSAMKQDDRVKVLEKMDPKIAAETSIMLKDVIPAKDRELAALQERLLAMEEAGAAEADKLSVHDLGETFASMIPKNAAALLVEMSKLSQPKVVAILSAMNNQARSRILSAVADVSKEVAAELTSELG